MSLLDLFKKPVPQTEIAVPRRPFVDRFTLDAAALRQGMWVTSSDGQIGIVTGCGADALVEITLTQLDGSNQMMLDENGKAIPLRIVRRIEQVRQSFIDEIPEPRRPSYEVLRSLGYRRDE